MSENAERKNADREGTTQKTSESSGQASGYGFSITGRASLSITDSQYSGMSGISIPVSSGYEAGITEQASLSITDSQHSGMSGSNIPASSGYVSSITGQASLSITDNQYSGMSGISIPVSSGYGASITEQASLNITGRQRFILSHTNTTATRAEEITAISCQSSDSDRLSEQQKKLARLKQQGNDKKVQLAKCRLHEQQESSAATDKYNDSKRLNHQNQQILKGLQAQQEHNKEKLSALKQQEIWLKKNQLKEESTHNREQKSLSYELKQRLEDEEGKLTLLKDQQKRQHCLNALEKQKQVRQPDSTKVQEIQERFKCCSGTNN